MSFSSGLAAAIEALGEVNLAYKARIAELEATVQTQQQIIEELRNPKSGEPPPRDGNAAE